MRLHEAFRGNIDINQGIYISLDLTDESARRIHDALSMLMRGDMVSEDDMHLTLMYAEDSQLPNGFISREGIFEYDGSFGIELFSDKKDTLVLTLENNSEINKRHNRLRAYGLKHSYDEYRPHITLSYMFDENDYPTGFLDNLKDAANQRIGKLQFKGEYISNVKKNWADSLEK